MDDFDRYNKHYRKLECLRELEIPADPQLVNKIFKMVEEYNEAYENYLSISQRRRRGGSSCHPEHKKPKKSPKKSKRRRTRKRRSVRRR